MAVPFGLDCDEHFPRGNRTAIDRKPEIKSSGLFFHVPPDHSANESESKTGITRQASWRYNSPATLRSSKNDGVLNFQASRVLFPLSKRCLFPRQHQGQADCPSWSSTKKPSPLGQPFMSLNILPWGSVRGLSAVAHILSAPAQATRVISAFALVPNLHHIRTPDANSLPHSRAFQGRLTPASGVSP